MARRNGKRKLNTQQPPPGKSRRQSIRAGSRRDTTPPAVGTPLI